MSKNKPKNLFVLLPELAKRAEELIRSGVLNKDNCWHELHSTLSKEFHEQIGKTGQHLSMRLLQVYTDKAIWTKEAKEALKKIVGWNQPLTKFHEHHKHIPMKMVEKKAKEITGLSANVVPATFSKGIGRIGDLDSFDENFRLPKNGLSCPVEIPVNKDNFSIMVINGANIGLVHKRVIEENPVRSALLLAQEQDYAAIFIPNPLNVDFKKAGGAPKIGRSMVSGLNLNTDILDVDYRKAVKEMLAGKTYRYPIHETVAERILNLLSGLAKITAGVNKKIYFIFGYIEEQLIRTGAYWELRYNNLKLQEELRAELASVHSAMKSQGISIKEKHDLEKIKNSLLKQISRTVISNITAEDDKKYARKVMHFIVEKFEAAIPNGKIIGYGNTVVKAGNNKIKFTIPRHLRVSDSLLSDNVRPFGSRAIRKGLADLEIICSPYALRYGHTVRETNNNGERGDAQFVMTPIAVDGDFLREILDDVISSPHPISKVIASEKFRPGVLKIDVYNDMINVGPISIGALNYARIIANKATKKSNLTKKSGSIPDNKYIWIMEATDLHYGSPDREQVWCESRERFMGVAEAAMQMMRDAGIMTAEKMPVSILTCNDDFTQGQHFENYKQPDPQVMSYSNIERLLSEAYGSLKNASPEKVREIFYNSRKMVLDQLRFRGYSWLQDQVEEVFERLIGDNVDFFDAVATKATNKESALIIKGVSKHTNRQYDARDMGVINLGTGNHFAATIEDNLTEGFLYGTVLRAKLSAIDKWKNEQDLLKKLVVAPLEGNQYFAWGTIKSPIKGAYEWGIEFRSNPARMTDWADPIRGAVNNDIQRADYGYFMTGRMTLKTYGDKHFYGSASIDQAFYHICASGTHTNLYGHRGWTPNNTGVSFIGLPVFGPDSGPILVRTLRYRHMVDYFKKPYKFDWDEFLPNPV